MEAKFTPGPWIVDGAMIVPASAVKTQMGYQSGEYIAQCYPTLYKTIAGNLRLIAAAPDLLAALEAVDKWYEDDGSKKRNPFPAVKAAIAKARGGA